MHAQDHAVFDAGTLETGARNVVPARIVMPAGTGDAPICFVDVDTETPLAWRPYRLQIGAHLVLGRTDAAGSTAVLTGAQRGALAGWELE
jgi:hypothetical protein